MRPMRNGSSPAAVKARQAPPRRVRNNDGLEQVKKTLLQTQKQLLEKSAALERQRLEKYQELGMIVHGLRNPASSILSATEYLIEDAAGSLTEEQVVLLRGSAQCSMTILRMIDNVLDLSKLERGVLKLKRTRAELVQLIEAVVCLNQSRAEWKAVCVKVHSDRPALVIDVDAQKITQAINNLFCYALESLPSGGKITIQIGADETFASVSISAEREDMSPGHKRLLDRAQNGATSQPDMTDAGLGFAVAKRIVGLHEGTVDVQNQDGKGSLLTINLPWRVNAKQTSGPALGPGT